MPSREYIRLGTRVIAIENIPPAVAAPTFSPPGGTYCALTVTISTATAGATIRYTLDGSTPTETNCTVGTSVAIGSSKTLKAIAYKSGMTDSAVTSASYTIAAEAVSQPSMPSGPASVMLNTTVTYSTGGATDSCGNPAQYLFYWGDGSNTRWLPVGTVSASHSWSSTGTYSVTAVARSPRTRVSFPPYPPR